MFPDIVICNIAHWDGTKERIVVDNKNYIDGQEHKTVFEVNESYAADFVQLPWRAYQTVYQSDFLRVNNLEFDEDIIGAEDCDFYIKLIREAKTFFLSTTVIVRYRMSREGSIINTPSFRSVIGQLIVFARAFESANMFSNVSLMREYFADRYANIIILVNMLRSQTEREHCYRFLEEHKGILIYTSKNAKYIFAKLMWNMFGFRVGSNILLRINAIKK